MDATHFLQSDHDRIKSLLAGLTDARSDAAARAFAFRSLRAALVLHARVEERIFYPAMMRVRSMAARAAVRAAVGEHHHMDSLLAELDHSDPDDARFVPAAEALRAALERHMAEEEGPLFGEARMHLTDERRERLGRRMEALQATLRETDGGRDTATVAGGTGA